MSKRMRLLQPPLLRLRQVGLLALFTTLSTTLLVTDAGHVYTDSFPTHDEYDHMILDADSVYGSPYGGFSRATASRLAGLTLKLPNIGDELIESDISQYETIRDYEGRPFACRVYHEDELEPSSLGDSMFDAPVLKAVKEEEAKKGKGKQLETATERGTKDLSLGGGETKVETDPLETANVDGANMDTAEQEEETQIYTEMDKLMDPTVTSASGPKLSKKIGPLVKTHDGHFTDPIAVAHMLNQRLKALVGMCAQIHRGWWSYSWCHQADVKQFHVVVESSKTSNVQNIQLEDISILGKFAERQVKLNEGKNVEAEVKVDENGRKKKDYTGGREALGTITETFLDGDVCPETDQPRQTKITLQCCSEKVISRTKGGVLLNGKPIESNLAALVDLSESEEPPCMYSMTICTPLLCADWEDGLDSITSKQLSSPSSSTTAPSTTKGNLGATDGNMDAAEVEKMSVMEVLHAMFGKKGTLCLLFGTGGWWVYEFCPGGTIRQYHEITLMDRTTGEATNRIETEHYLGRYKAEDHEGVTKESEWKHMVNVTNGTFGSSSSSSSSSATAASIRSKNSLGLGGNGAYYVQEYTDGDACINEDVEDSAAYGTRRATTVRYYCGTSLQMTVKEDSTCHYVVDITVPALCGHPLFKPPVSKKQVVKCLPLPLGYEGDLL